MNWLAKTLTTGLFALGLSACSDSNQQADPDFTPQNTERRFSSDNSPLVLFDEAHHNFLTMHGRYRAFTDVLQSDGYTVIASTQPFTEAHLNQADILVITNALDRQRSDFSPPFGSAFTAQEVAAVMRWIEQGGALFLVADHTPFPRVIDNLTTALGIEFSDGHVGNAHFSITDQTLASHAITLASVPALRKLPGATSMTGFGVTSAVGGAASAAVAEPPSGQIEQVRSFGGSAFKVPDGATSLLTLGPGATSVTPDIPFQVTADTPRVAVDGWSQGAVLELGKGRVAVFAEGMMFSSQRDTSSGKKYGMNSAGAEHNEGFLLNVMAWLVRAD
ncbi:DUF4350 domain-containing protein [Pseudoalteromonas sp. OOF1S-7]|uniref:DUF4350 domain-containing protein n=1 Tax=Pseudoalteromonas sp. OOF1S-7 TaxID=2917757 RepID=UPI001EF55203|nr:DUF4350 domain-containing protein [Pseudoalteromonas sp. OOF1S-7]MCG7535178.1 DUF4350 domain-containing protein [Pseudoalteromonas sp. OOF1S-7]